MKFEDVEKARETLCVKVKKYNYIYLVTFVIMVVMVIGFLAAGPDVSRLFMIVFPVMLMVFSLIIVSIIVSFTTKKERFAYRSAYKAYFVEKIMRETFTNLNYDHAKGIPKDILRGTGMVNTGDSYGSNDLTIARYKNVSLMQADVHIQERRTDSDGNSYYVTIFKGRFMFFEFPKKFNFVLELVGRRAGAVSVPRSSKTGKRLNLMKTESGDFNRRFRIFAEDEFEMFYILNPAFMEKIQMINDYYDDRVMFGFIGNKLMVSLNDGKDSFEPPRYSRPIDEKEELAKNRADLRVITDFVDFLSLDKKLFK